MGKKAGRFFKISQSHFYNGIIGVVLFMYAGELFLFMVDSNGSMGLLNDFNNQSPRASILMTIGIGFVFFLIFLAINSLSLTATKAFQSASVIIKFLPILIVTIVGIIAGANNYDQSFINQAATTTASRMANNQSFTTILIVLPSILFSFDSFLSFTSIQDKMLKPQKYSKIILSIGVITVSIAYILITLGMIFLGNGFAVSSINENLLTTVFKVDAERAKTISYAFRVIFNIFLLISILGVANAFMIVTISNHQGLINDDLIFGSKW
ncbi:Amino acid permease, partial [Mycoplasmoides gallisepticum]